MNSHFQRAQLLVKQLRYDLAERELRQALAAQPDDPASHALLALCLAHADRYAEAMAEAKQAVHLDPEYPFGFYALARALETSQRFDEAKQAINEALRLDPHNSDYFAVLASIGMQLRRWAEALAAAEEGLTNSPEHVNCANFRAMALVKLGRKDVAGTVLEAALARAPDSALTHANEGWRQLELRGHAKALEHFREALRIDPGLDYAREGIVEALRARYFMYRVMLSYFLWMSKLSRRAQWWVVIGGYVGYQVLRSVARRQPEVAPWIFPVLAVYFAFVIMTWIARPLFNALLRFNRYGRLVLSREEIVISNLVAPCMVVGLVSLGAYLASSNMLALVTAAVAMLVIPPLSQIYNCEAGWPRRAMVWITLGLAALGVLTVAANVARTLGAGTIINFVGSVTLLLFVVAALAAQFAANALVLVRVRRA